MSTGERIPLDRARELAQNVMTVLEPYCERIEIAGSIRRKKVDVGDIELVCIPHEIPSYNLFGEETRERDSDGIAALIALQDWPLSKNGEHFKQFDIGPCKVDLFLTTPECWGVIFTIRTGSADFSHRLVTPRNKGGYMPSYLQVMEGRIVLRENKMPFETPEETDVFQVMHLAWRPPEARI